MVTYQFTFIITLRPVVLFSTILASVVTCILQTTYVVNALILYNTPLQYSHVHTTILNHHVNASLRYCHLPSSPSLFLHYSHPILSFTLSPNTKPNSLIVTPRINMIFLPFDPVFLSSRLILAIPYSHLLMPLLLQPISLL